MPKIKRLSIPCDVTLTSPQPDWLHITVDEGIQDRIYLMMVAQGPEACGNEYEGVTDLMCDYKDIVLTKDTARQLFSYLGVYLHTF